MDLHAARSERATAPGQAPENHRLPEIKAWLPTSLIEWEGRLSCSVFLGGCNFRCPFCHAADLVLRSGELGSVPLSEVLTHLEEREGWVDGVVVSGGEATLQPGLPKLIETLRGSVGAVKLDTNGSRPRVVEALIDGGLIDCVSMDVKAPLGPAYSAAAGVAVDCEAVGASIELIRSRGIEHEFRTTVVPGLHTRDDVVGIARELGRTETLILQQFAPLQCLDPTYLDRRPYSRVQLREMAEAASEFVAECRLRGETPSGGTTQ